MPIARVPTGVIGNRKDERLDLVVFDKRGSERVLIEVKFWAGLTSKQPEEYLERLPRNGDPAVLLFGRNRCENDPVGWILRERGLTDRADL